MFKPKKGKKIEIKKDEIIEGLIQAINENDCELASDFYRKIAYHSSGDLYIETLIKYLDKEWHVDHENIVSEFQHLKSPKPVDILKKTALKKFPYLEFNHSYSLARKCTWALADIGTKEAKKALEELAKVEDKEIARYAEKRLLNWEREMGRKGPSTK